MLKPFNQIKTKTIGADLSKVVDRIVRQYGDFPLAFQKEAIQNAWDARLDRKHAQNWIVKIDFIPNKNHIVVEDFGTTGMNRSGWEAFTALWKPQKKHADAGGQGQGKFVLMGGSKEHVLIVESKSKELPYGCRFLQNDQKDTQEKEYSLKDFKIDGVPPLNHQGTKVWVYDAKKDFLSALKSKNFIQEVAATWWQTLQKPYNAKVLFLGKQILLPRLPSIERDKVVLENKQIGSFGRIKRLVLQLYKKNLPKSFTGVRVQRAQMTVTSLPFEVYDKNYKDRLSGYVLFDEKLEPALKKIEKTDHCGFVYESPWKEIKKLIEKEIEKFKEEVIPKEEKRKPISPGLHDEIISKANQIIMDYMPELGKVTGPIVPSIKRKPPSPLRIDSLTVDKREEVKFNEPVQRKCAIKNETDKSKKILLEIFLKHMGQIIDKESYRFKVKAKGKRLLILSHIKLDKSHHKGKYTVRGVIKEDGHERHTKATSFYLEAKRPRLKSGFIKKCRLQEFPDATIRNSRLKDGNLTANVNHPDFQNILNSFKNHPRLRNKQIKFYLLKVILDEAIRELFKHHLREDNYLEEEELSEILDLRDKVYYEVYI